MKERETEHVKGKEGKSRRIQGESTILLTTTFSRFRLDVEIHLEGRWGVIRRLWGRGEIK